MGAQVMAAGSRTDRRERAEAHAREAADAASRGEYRRAAVLYKMAVLALEGDDESAEERELALEAASGELPASEPPATEGLEAACPAEAE